MRKYKQMLLIKRFNCKHKWSFSDGIAPRWCYNCDIEAGGRVDREIRKLKFLMGEIK